ncbi:MAG: L-aspartate oxidase [Phycisphaerales bacterium]|nr:L-aspartate oxidase [Phycisphaerales bacterium]
MTDLVSVNVARRQPLACDPNRIAVLPFDAVIIGAGAAGATCAMAAARRGLRVAVMAKGPHAQSNTGWARGGIAAVLGEDDSFERHVTDTIACGCGLSDRTVVERIVQGAPEAINELIALGARFDRSSGGGLALGLEGGHTRHRIVHAGGDATGVEVQQALEQGLEGTPGITCFDDASAIDIVRLPDGGPVRGLLAELSGGDIVLLEAPDVVLATGGAGQIWRETTNPVHATADGLAIALRAGATARDLEFVQFHPTCLYIAGAARILISEIVRGSGAVLRDRTGEAFMASLHPDADLAPRDVVSRAIAERMHDTGATNVLLDLKDIEGDPAARFPGIAQACGQFGLDIRRDPIPVRPGAHYMVGGVRATLDGRTSIEGLHAIGECASTSLHGANRMASNSLLECLVAGRACGDGLAGADMPRSLADVPPPPRPDRVHANVNQVDMLYALKSLMWRESGVHRSGAGLEEAAAQLDFWLDVAQRLGGVDRQSRELRNMLLVARSVCACAAQRCESRGGHFRTDYPDTHAVAQHTLLTPCRGDDDALTTLALERESTECSTPA